MKRLSGPLLLALSVALFGYGVVRLFQLRYAAGDVYRPYSSLRADRLGAKALHDALEHYGLPVERRTESLERARGDRGTTFLVLGATAGDEPLGKALDRLAHEGARVVVTLFPEAGNAEGSEEEEVEEEAGGDGAAGAGEPAEDEGAGESGDGEGDGGDEEGGARAEASPGGWQLTVGLDGLPEDEEGERVAVVVERQVSLPLPQRLGWRSGLVFNELDGSWQTVYAREGKPVVVTRPRGAGALVLASDSYFVSNEALHEGAEPELLAWLLGSPTRVVFNETHLGVRDDPGIVGLARRYRLHGLAVALLVVAGLALWRASTGLVPPLEVAERGAPVAGRGAAEGLADLLRRGVAPDGLAAVCIEEWASASPDRRRHAAQLGRLAGTAAGPVDAYRRLCRAVATGRAGTTSDEGEP